MVKGRREGKDKTPHLEWHFEKPTIYKKSKPLTSQADCIFYSRNLLRLEMNQGAPRNRRMASSRIKGQRKPPVHV
jgi:hypothetical protein